MPEVFAGGQGRKLIRECEAKVRELHTKIGELTVERVFFLGADSVAALGGPDPDDRPGQPYEPLETVPAAGGEAVGAVHYVPKGEDGEEDLALMRRLDELHIEYPVYGSRQLMRHLRRDGVTVGRHRIRRLTRRMGIKATYRRPRTRVATPEHRISRYLPRGLTITRSTRVSIRTGVVLHRRVQSCWSLLHTRPRMWDPRLGIRIHGAG